ncbi:hypothetical protein scyTo_0002204 [Scyliorhinus torazame]|uniref:Uncharacterized protein n=1 Tax=Scyliorhinus torazame TaxID=75743 RepID=A0A401PI61_SCYTO|nr:hypothetical protein [Scyliorhinus torazame]
MAAGILDTGFAPGLYLALVAMFPGTVGGCRSAGGNWVEVTAAPHLPLSVGMAAKCIGLYMMLLLRAASASNGPGMIYQLLDLSTPLSPPAQQSFETSHLPPVWPWTSRPLRQRVLSSYLRSSSDVKAMGTESVEETITIKSDHLTFLVTTPEMDKNTATDITTTSRVPPSPQLSHGTETYKTWHTSELLTSRPADGEMLVIHRPKASSASPLVITDDTKANPPPPATASAAVRSMTDSELTGSVATTIPLQPAPTPTSFDKTATTISKPSVANAASRPALMTGHPGTASGMTLMPSSQTPAVSRMAGRAPNTTEVQSPIRTTPAPRSVPPLATVTASTGDWTNQHAETGKTSMVPSLTLTAALTSITTAGLAPRDTQATIHVTTAAKGTHGIPVSSPTLPSLTCRLSDQLWVRTVVTLSSRKIRADPMLKQNVTRGLTQALKRAFFTNGVQAQIESLERRNKVFIGFYAVSGREVYIPSAVTEAITTYGLESFSRDIKRHVPDLQSILISASPWAPPPARWFQLKTVLQFVSTTDIIKFCSFVQTMEARLQRAFEEAASRATNLKSNLSVQILNTSVTDGSTAVTMVYMVRNESTLLNGTTSSSLLHHLTAAELGYYLAYPPLILAEPLEYENLDTSLATEKSWVVTVLLGVDNTSLGEQYQRFASLMEQRLANLFVAAQQQGRRFKRASTFGTYTVQLVSIKRLPGLKNPAELTYYALENGGALLGTTAAKILNTVDSQTMALELGYRVQLQAELQGFDYAKQHIGQQGGEDEVTNTQETVVLPLSGRDALAPQERDSCQDGVNTKPTKTIDIRRSRLHSEQDSVINEQSGNLDSDTSTPQKATAQQKITKEGTRRKNAPVSDEEESSTLFEHVSKTSDDPFDTSSGSVQLLSVKPLTAHPGYPGSERSPEAVVVNGEVNKALKQKSDIEHYRNKLRLKAKRKGYYDFPEVENNQPMMEKQRKMYEKGQMEINRVAEAETQVSSTFTESRNRQSQMKSAVYRSRQSLNSPGPGGTEMDLLVRRERSRRGIRNSGYDTEPELTEETNVDRIAEPRTATRARQAKGHSESSTLSSQPSIDEVRQHMHQLLEEAFSLASAGRVAHGRHQLHYATGQPLPYTELVTSAPGTMSRSRAGLQWVPAYGQDMCQYSLPRPAYRYSQLPEMSIGSPPPLPPRNAPAAVTSLRRWTSENNNNARTVDSHSADQSQHEAPYVSRATAPAEQPITNYSGSSVPAVYAIPANRPGFPNYFISAPSPYRTHAWTPYVGDGEAQAQWAENVTLPGYVEAFSHARYAQNAPHQQYSQTQPSNPPRCIEQAQTPSTAASQQSLTENESSETSYTNISTAALVKAIREEVAKLAKKQTGMFEFQV